MLVSNLEIVPGKRLVKHLGLVQGRTVRAKHVVGKDIMADLKIIVGGELKGYTELLQAACAQGWPLSGVLTPIPQPVRVLVDSDGH
jgi:uncharacterized protein YbjQ (UPF0145 family)